MAEKRKLSVQEILAAARKQDAGRASGRGVAPGDAAQVPPAEPVAENKQAPAAAKPEEPAQPAGQKPKPVASGARPSVAEMIAIARAGKGAAAAPATPTAEEAPKPVEKPKPTPKSEAQPAAKEKETSPAAGAMPRTTASILDAARGGKKLGPVSKAEAGLIPPRDDSQAKAPEEKPEAKPAKGKPVVPPMPAKPDYAKRPTPAATTAVERRGFMAMLAIAFGSFLAAGFSAMAGTFGLWTLGLARFMFPNILTEPPSRFKIGLPAEFPAGKVDERFKSEYGVWIVNAEYNGQAQIFALSTVCTHLGCTPNWLEAEQKFKCPCHGSGFYKDGINFEGPAPRPLERHAIRIADDGQLEVDKSRLFQEEKGEWSNPDSYVLV